jgi:hypothetical protein
LFSLLKVAKKFRHFRINHGYSSLLYMRRWMECAGKCIICGQQMLFWVPFGAPNRGLLATWDHNHATRQSRRLICTGCNKGLGAFRDNPAIVSRALVYLQSEGNYATGNSILPL